MNRQNVVHPHSRVWFATGTGLSGGQPMGFGSHAKSIDRAVEAAGPLHRKGLGVVTDLELLPWAQGRHQEAILA